MGFFKNLFYGKSPVLVAKGILKGNLTKNLYEEIENRVERLLSTFDNVKIGKTGQPRKRIDKEDYRGTYTRMYLLYSSDKKAKIDNLEIKLIEEYFDELDNISDRKGGNMISVNGKYYVYAVVK